jgi:hypothetical protein
MKDTMEIDAKLRSAAEKFNADNTEGQLDRMMKSFGEQRIPFQLGAETLLAGRNFEDLPCEANIMVCWSRVLGVG